MWTSDAPLIRQLNRTLSVRVEQMNRTVMGSVAEQATLFDQLLEQCTSLQKLLNLGDLLSVWESKGMPKLLLSCARRY